MKYIPFILLLIIQIYLLDKQFYSISADEAGHTIEAFRFYRGEPFFSIWLPFHKVFLGLFLFNDLFWIPRYISMIFGHLTLVCLMLVTHQLFKLEIVTLIICISYIFNSMEKKIKYLLIFIFPLSWVILGWISTGDVLGFINQVSVRKRVFRPEDSVLYNFLLISTTTGLIIGVFVLRKNKEYLWLFISTLIIWSVGTQLSGAMATHNLWRVGLAWNVLLIPFTAFIIYSAKSKLLSVLIFSGIIYLSFLQLQNHTLKSYTTIDDIKAGEVIKNLEGKIYVGKYGWEFTNLLLFNPHIIPFDTLSTNFDYLILMQKTNLKEYYRNNKWTIYK